MELRIDTRSLTRFSRIVRKTAPELTRGFRQELRAAGLIVAEDARSRASFSLRIPGSIRVRTTQGGKISVVAGGAQALDAVVLEHRGVPGTFRHPVWGNRDVWVDQLSHPFLHPALEAKGEEARAAAGRAVVKTFRLIMAEAA